LILREDEKQSLLEGIRKLSDIFWGPDPQKCAEILSGSFWIPFEEITPLWDLSSTSALEKFKGWVQTFPDAESLCTDLEETYVRLFISNRKGITPLYASCYIGGNAPETTPVMGEPALDMKERFLSKGLSLAEDIGEPPDHLSIELEYLYFLLEKGWTEKNDLLLEEACSFSSETMLPWILKFERRLAALEIETSFYLHTTTLLGGILEFVKRLHLSSKK
jgi:TorA maturation chaperone TorD